MAQEVSRYLGLIANDERANIRDLVGEGTRVAPELRRFHHLKAIGQRVHRRPVDLF
jgi:hypothetical protein